MQVGFGVFLFETIAVMVYLATTPSRPQEQALWSLTAACVVVCVGCMLFVVPAVASRSWRVMFSLGWTLVTVVAVGFVAAPDGGLDSPLLLLLFLPIVYAALALPPVGTLVCGVLTLAVVGYMAGAVPTPGTHRGNAVMTVSVLTGASFLAVASSVNRARLERRERRLAHQLAEQATVDGLTGCLNHAAFNQRLVEEIHRAVRHGHALSLALIDLDEFKKVNDDHGHLTGDRVLTDVGSSLRALSRTADVIGRIGGDEFALLMPHTEPADAVTFAQRLRQSLPAPPQGHVTLSIGVAGLDHGQASPRQLLQDADAALYEIKKAGRDGVALRPQGRLAWSTP